MLPNQMSHTSQGALGMFFYKFLRQNKLPAGRGPTAFFSLGL